MNFIKKNNNKSKYCKESCRENLMILIPNTDYQQVQENKDKRFLKKLKNKRKMLKSLMKN